jgi:hypothetical protein
MEVMVDGDGWLRGRELLLMSTVLMTCVSIVAKLGLYFTFTNSSLGVVFNDTESGVHMLYHREIHDPE